MELTIKEENGNFLVEGIINSTTVKKFKNHLEFLLLYNKSVTLDIGVVSFIDAAGLQALKELKDLALSYKKPFDIVGYGCKAIYEYFENESASY